MSEHDSIAPQIKALRERSGLSVRELAARARMAPSTYSHYENPDRFKDSALKLRIAQQLAQAFEGTPVSGSEVLALVGLSPTPQPEAEHAGFLEAAEPFSLEGIPGQGDPKAALRAIFGSQIGTPECYRMRAALPAFALREGDVVVIDMSRTPVAGELALVSVVDPDLGSASHTVCQFLPPFLAPGDFAQRPLLLKTDAENVAAHYPVIGTIRGQHLRK